jgi:subtilisin family serine protease
MTRSAVLCLALAVLCAGARGSSAQAFPNSQPDAPRQWYLTQDNAWSAWSTPPKLATVKVAVIDSGIDAGDPAFAGQIAAGRSFVGGSWRVDTNGHGTFVAGLVAANAFNGVGVAGIAFNAKLLIAKVLDNVGVIPPGAEAAAIRWAANEGAGVINLSLGGLRDPNDPELDGYSRSELEAVEYAYSKGAVVVAAVGNGTNAPTHPWPFADYPAALPNVLGVSALNEDGSVPNFSNRDSIYVDLAAPGAGIFSTIPRNLEDSADDPGCAGDPYSNCGPAEFQSGDGTSFAAPQVAAAAALLLGVDPRLAPDQVDWILERSATDMTPANGCSGCTSGRDALTGWGRLDIARAVGLLRSGVTLPPPDVLEPDDDAGDQAYPLTTLPRTVTSSEDYWDDASDVFALPLHPGQELVASLTGLERATMTLRLWRPGTVRLATAPPSSLAASSTLTGNEQLLSYRPPGRGVYYLQVLDRAPSRQRAVYHLTVTDRPATTAPA